MIFNDLRDKRECAKHVNNDKSEKLTRFDTLHFFFGGRTPTVVEKIRFFQTRIVILPIIADN